MEKKMPKGQPNKGYALTPQRERVLRVLAEGPLDADDGRLVGDLARRLGYDNTQALSMVIKQLETAGLIRRDVAGRRTYHLELIVGALAPEDWPRLSRPTAAAVAPEHADEPLGVVDLTDYRLLADELLKAALKSLSPQAGLEEELIARRQEIIELKSTIRLLRLRDMSATKVSP